MRWPHARFTIRRMVVVVIVIGVILGTLVLLDHRRRWYGYCKMRADKHYEAQAEMEMMADGHRPSYGFHSPYLSAKYKRLADYHAQMRRKWEIAAGRPGEPVAPDPPEPR
jgi:hypothetical protein